VATKTGIEIVLDKPESQAVFKNGDETVFNADRESTFLITFERGCNANEGGADAEAYYTAVGHLVPDEEKIRFAATPLPPGTTPPNTSVGPPNDPDARCMNGSMSVSHPGGG
jgi:hypothetical protein